VKKNTANSEPLVRVSDFHLNLHPCLFTFLDSVTGVLNSDQARVAMVLNTVQVESVVRDTGWTGGRPPCSLKASARAFLVKAVLNIPTTKDLVSRLDVDFGLRTLCGFGGRVPSESTFSRHFKTFSESGVMDTLHEGLVRNHVGTDTVHHLCRDSSSIQGRETSKVKRERPCKPKQGGGEPAPQPPKDPSRIPDQLTQDYRTSLDQLPRVCDIGTKTGSKGHVFHWIGFKLHLDVADGGLPISAFTTSASVHDSQLAIPLSRMSGYRVGGIFYDQSGDLSQRTRSSNPTRQPRRNRPRPVRSRPSATIQSSNDGRAYVLRYQGQPRRANRQSAGTGKGSHSLDVRSPERLCARPVRNSLTNRSKQPPYGDPDTESRTSSWANLRRKTPKRTFEHA